MIRIRNYWSSELKYRRREIHLGISVPRAGFGRKMKRAAHKAERVIGKRLMREQMT